MQDRAPDDPRGAHPKTDWAEDRTDWAEDRTILANERTFAGWIRTAMACVAVAIGLKAVFGELQPTWAAKLVASIFILAALYMLWATRNRAARTAKRMDQHDARSLPTSRMTVIAALLAVASVATGAVLWVL